MDSMAILKKKWDDLLALMASLGILESDLFEKFILGSGKGGQHLQKTSSCVYLRHIPTGLEVKCQKERERDTNRYVARKMLLEAYREKILKEKTEKKNLLEKIRRQKRRRTRRTQKKLLENKRMHGEKKSLRKGPSLEE
jgi:peptide chain release factor